MVASPTKWLSNIIPVSMRQESQPATQPVRQTVYAMPTFPDAPTPISSKGSSLRGPQPKQLVGPNLQRVNPTPPSGPQGLPAAYPFRGGTVSTGPSTAVGSHWYSGSPTGVGAGYYGRV